MTLPKEKIEKRRGLKSNLWKTPTVRGGKWEEESEKGTEKGEPERLEENQDHILLRPKDKKIPRR